MPANKSARRNSILIAAAIAIALVAWIASGLGRDVPEAGRTDDAAREARMEVAVRQFHAPTTLRRITVSARTEPDRWVEIKAETEGRVVAIRADRGASVTEGQAVVELDMRDRRARLAETEALIRQRELEFEAASRLRDQGFMSAAEVAAAESLLVGARASRERIDLDIQRTHIAAPFDAIVYDRLVEIGDYVAIGDPIAQLVDSDPLIVVGDINQREIAGLDIGATGVARLLDQREVEGTIRYIAPVADESTRSFRIELAIPNPDRRLRVGTSAELILGGESITAHSVSSGLLLLGNDETIGVMTVDETDHARFMPVEIAGASSDGVLVTGLPPRVTLITVGQGFVVDGEAVIPVEDSLGLNPEQR